MLENSELAEFCHRNRELLNNWTQNFSINYKILFLIAGEFMEKLLFLVMDVDITLKIVTSFLSVYMLKLFYL